MAIPSYSAVYKINLYSVNHIIAKAPVKLVLPKNLEYPDRKYTAVTAFYDNSFYVGRSGPDNTSVYDPDNAIIQFLAPNDSIILPEMFMILILKLRTYYS